MISFSNILEETTAEITESLLLELNTSMTKKYSKGGSKKLGGGKLVIHDAKWKKQQKLKRKWARTAKGKLSKKLSGMRTTRAGYKHKERKGKYRAKP